MHIEEIHQKESIAVAGPDHNLVVVASK